MVLKRGDKGVYTLEGCSFQMGRPYWDFNTCTLYRLHLLTSGESDEVTSPKSKLTREKFTYVDNIGRRIHVKILQMSIKYIKYVNVDNRS
jgi:hypothetical protein